MITHVNGKSATSVPIYELRRMLRDEAPDTWMHFTIKRGSQARNVDAKLRDQI